MPDRATDPVPPVLTQAYHTHSYSKWRSEWNVPHQLYKKKKKKRKKKTSYSSETISTEYVVDDMAVLQGKKAKYKE